MTSYVIKQDINDSVIKQAIGFRYTELAHIRYIDYLDDKELKDHIEEAGFEMFIQRGGAKLSRQDKQARWVLMDQIAQDLLKS